MTPIDKDNLPGLHRLLEELGGKYRTLMDMSYAGDKTNQELLGTLREQIDELAYVLKRSERTHVSAHTLMLAMSAFAVVMMIATLVTVWMMGVGAH